MSWSIGHILYFDLGGYTGEYKGKNPRSCTLGLVHCTVYTLDLLNSEDKDPHLVFCGRLHLLADECFPGLRLQQSSEESVGRHCQELYFRVWVEAVQRGAFWRKRLLDVLVVA